MQYNELRSIAVKAIDTLIATSIDKNLVFKMLEISEEVYESLKSPEYEEVIAQKLWSVEDVVDTIEKRYDSAPCSDDAIEAAVQAIKRNAGLEDCSDSEWEVIKDAIDRTTVLKVFDIEWKVDEEEFDDEAEYHAVVENLPDTVEIQPSVYDGYRHKISAILTDTYGYGVKGYRSQIIKKEAA